MGESSSASGQMNVKVGPVIVWIVNSRLKEKGSRRQNWSIWGGDGFSIDHLDGSALNEIWALLLP